MQKKYKVVHVITSLDIGGAEASLFRLISRSDDDHAVICLGKGGLFVSRIQELGVEVICLDMKSSVSAVKGFVKLIGLLRKKFKVHILQTWLYHADFVVSIAALFARKNLGVWSVRHALIRRGDLKLTTNGLTWLNGVLSYFSPTVLVYNSRSGRFFHEHFRGYDERKGKVIPNGIDVDVFKPCRAARPLIKSPFRIGCVGRYDIQKNQRLLLTVASRLLALGIVDFEIWFAGRGLDHSNSEFCREIESLGVSENIKLLGVQKNMASFYQQLDLMVLTSDTEAFPNVLAEAMACGVIAVSTKAGDAEYIVGDPSRLVEIGGDECLANIILGLIERSSDKKWWASEQYKVRQRVVEIFPLEAMVIKYRQLWEELAESN